MSQGGHNRSKSYREEAPEGFYALLTPLDPGQRRERGKNEQAILGAFIGRVTCQRASRLWPAGASEFTGTRPPSLLRHLSTSLPPSSLHSNPFDRNIKSQRVDLSNLQSSL
jgi:hypothetical protein